MSALAANDDPVDARKRDALEGSEQRFDAEKPYRCLYLSEVLDSSCVLLVLHADSEPDVRRETGSTAYFHQSLRPLRQDLELVLASPADDIEYTADVFHRHVLVKQIRHAVHEDATAAAPAKGKLERRLDESEIESLFERMPRYAPEPFRKGFGVAVFAPG
jgi:hypothetical protein